MSSEKHTIKMAAPSEKDIDITLEFLGFMDSLFDSRMHSSGMEETWERDMDDDDEDKKRMLAIRKEIAEEEGLSESDVDNRLIFFEIIKRKYKACDCSWRRVVWGGLTALENLCDHHSRTIDIDPMIYACMQNGISYE
jgi:hypothetical protein